MRSCQDPSHTIQGSPEVISIPGFCRPRVYGHADAYRLTDFFPRFGSNLVLRSGCRLKRIVDRRKHRAERIAYGFEDSAAPPFNNTAQNRIMSGKRSPHPFRELLPELRAAFNIRK